MRTDIHRPSAIVPTDYEYVGMECMKIEGLGDVEFIRQERERIKRHMEHTGGTYSRHEHGGNCHVCGSVNAIYTHLFHHVPTNSYVRTGTECTDRLDYAGAAGDMDAFKHSIKAAADRRAGKAKAAVTLADAGLSSLWDAYVIHEGMRNRNRDFAQIHGSRDASPEAEIEWRAINTYFNSVNHGRTFDYTLADMIDNLIRYGSWSEKQAAYAARMWDRLQRADEIAAQRTAETAAAAPVPVSEKRIKIAGKILSTKSVETAYGVSIKMLVQHADGWKVWGTRPDSLAAEKGDTVEFEARVTVSEDDAKFGFFSRPTKARVVTVPA